VAAVVAAVRCTTGIILGEGLLLELEGDCVDLLTLMFPFSLAEQLILGVVSIFDFPVVFGFVD
jgi:hypothetical protein